MSEKETSQKIVTKYDRKVQRRKEEELKEQRQKKINRVIGIAILAVIIIALASIPVRKYIATHSTYITVGGDEITRAEFDYYYNLAKNEYLNTYGSIMSYMGLNVNSDFSTQRYSETMTWQDYFEQLAVDAIKQNKALLAEAKAAGFTYDVSKEYEAFARSLENGAAESGESLGRYYKINFGRYATVSSIRPYVEEGYLAAAYYNAVSEQKGASDEEIKAYYDENKAEYDSVDFLLTEIEAQIPEAKTVTDEAGNESTAEPTEEEIRAAMDAAKEKAEEALLVIETEGAEKTGIQKSSIPIAYNGWLFDEARKEGDTTIAEDTEAHKYYVVLFKNRYLDETPTATVRTIVTSAGNSEAILAEWEAAGGTEDAFISLVGEYSEDSYTNKNGGLYKELGQANTESALNTWIFDDSRKPGDVTTIAEDIYTYIVYYVEESRPTWQAKIASTLLSDVMEEYLEEIKGKCEVSDPKGHLAYLKAESTNNTVAGTDETESTPVETETE